MGLRREVHTGCEQQSAPARRRSDASAGSHNPPASVRIDRLMNCGEPPKVREVFSNQAVSNFCQLCLSTHLNKTKRNGHNCDRKATANHPIIPHIPNVSTLIYGLLMDLIQKRSRQIKQVCGPVHCFEHLNVLIKTAIYCGYSCYDPAYSLDKTTGILLLNYRIKFVVLGNLRTTDLIR